jgi:kynurenine formamidase
MDMGKWPGIDNEVAQWVVEKKASMIGSDCSADLTGLFSVHFELLMKNGIYNLEFMTFESLLSDEVDEFLFILTPLRIKGATGSPEPPRVFRRPG